MVIEQNCSHSIPRTEPAGWSFCFGALKDRSALDLDQFTLHDECTVFKINVAPAKRHGPRRDAAR